MSRSRDDNADFEMPENNRINALYEMMFQGRSFSGHERNCCFLNTLGSESSGERFATVSAVSGLDVDDDGRGLSQVDWDHDGDLDLWISNRNAPRLRFFRNDTLNQNRYVQFQLIGNGTDTNGNAIGARIELLLKPTGDSATGKRLIKTLRAGEGFISQSSRWMHFGLGTDLEIDRIRVHWPNQAGDQEEFAAVAVNGRYILEQGTGVARPLDQPRGALAIDATPMEVPPMTRSHHIPIVYPLSVPTLGYFGFDGTPHEVRFEPGQATLINLWSNTCRPCIQELTDFAKRHEELKAAGIRIVAISIDDLECEGPEGKEQAEALAKRLGLPFEVGMAPPRVIEELRQLHNILITVDRPLPMPASFLVNRQGRLEVIYKGTVDIDTLLQDAADRQLDTLQRFELAAAFPGEMIDHDVLNSAMVRNEGSVHYRLSRQLAMAGRIDDAIRELQHTLTLWPDSGKIINDLGVMLMSKNQVDQAAEHFDQAFKLKSNDPDILANLIRAMDLQGKQAEARSLAEEAVELFPNHANSHFQLGLFKARDNDFTGARASLEQAIAFEPRHERALLSLGNMLSNIGLLSDAKEYLRQAANAAPDNPVIYISLGQVSVRERQLEQAEAWYRRATECSRPLADAYFQLGMVLSAQGKTQDAKLQFERCIKIDPAHSAARTQLQAIGHGFTSSN